MWKAGRQPDWGQYVQDLSSATWFSFYNISSLLISFLLFLDQHKGSFRSKLQSNAMAALQALAALQPRYIRLILHHNVALRR